MATRRAQRAVSAEELRAILAREAAFAALSDRALASLARAAERELVPAGSELLGAGVVPDSAFIVVHGRLRVTDARASERAGHEVAFELGRGGIAGLNLLVGQIPSAGTLIAMRDSTVLRLRRDALMRCFSSHPELLVAQARHFYETALRSHTTPPAVPHIITLLPVRGAFAVEDVLRAFARALTDTLGPTSVVDSRRAAEILGVSPERGGEALRARMSEWVGGQEERGLIVLFVCDREATLWTRWCLEQTDRIVVASDPGDADAIAYVDRILASRSRSSVLADILLVHPANADIPRGTRPWMELAWRRQHHHVRVDRRRDFLRAARRIGERGVSIVLGGGGARALAHIGLLQALEDLGVPVDAIGGTSMGSVVAAAYACGRTPEEMLRLFAVHVPDGRALRDVDFPAVSLLAGKKLDRVLRFAFEDLDVSDAWIPCFCVSADVAGALMVVRDRGPLWEAVRASCSLPGVFPPVQHGSSLLVDGGVMDNVPIEVMEREHPGSTIIACDVGAPGIGPIESVPATPRSGWRRLGDRIRGRGAAEESVTPSIMHILTSATMLGSRDELNRMVTEGHADLLLVPPVQHVKLLGFEARDDLYRIGYEHAHRALAAWSGLARVATRPAREERATADLARDEHRDRP